MIYVRTISPDCSKHFCLLYRMNFSSSDEEQIDDDDDDDDDDGSDEMVSLLLFALVCFAFEKKTHWCE